MCSLVVRTGPIQPAFVHTSQEKIGRVCGNSVYKRHKQIPGSLRSCHLNSKSRIFTASFVSGGFGFFVREFEFFGLIGPVVQIILSRTVATDA